MQPGCSSNELAILVVHSFACLCLYKNITNVLISSSVFYLKYTVA